jgi:hypothetical protein
MPGTSFFFSIFPQIREQGFSPRAGQPEGERKVIIDLFAKLSRHIRIDGLVA